MPSHFDVYRSHPLYRALQVAAQKRPTLFHGTRYGKEVERSNALILPDFGYQCVSLTRDPAVALHFAHLDRDNDASCGHVYVFDRMKLASRYKIAPRSENWWNYREEAEEAVWWPISNLHSFVTSVVEVRSPELKSAVSM